MQLPLTPPPPLLQLPPPRRNKLRSSQLIFINLF
jgi:hypothetical protein